MRRKRRIEQQQQRRRWQQKHKQKVMYNLLPTNSHVSADWVVEGGVFGSGFVLHVIYTFIPIRLPFRIEKCKYPIAHELIALFISLPLDVK